jgi:hypothetical protein
VKRLSISILTAVIALLIIAVGVFAAQMNFRAHMKTGVILPVTEGSHAQGQAIFKLSEDGMSMSYKLNVANIDHVFAAHIHRYVGDGVNGPILVWLYPSTSPGGGTPTGRVDGTLVSGSFGPGNLIGVSWEQFLELMRSGDAYVNVHTSEAPGGEINGHIH